MVLKKFKYKKVSSTNDIAMKKIRQGYKSGIIISDKQTRGRGQHGKKWVSNKGNLFFSIFFRGSNSLLKFRITYFFKWIFFCYCPNYFI